jgi:hypothetical protein
MEIIFGGPLSIMRTAFIAFIFGAIATETSCLSQTKPEKNQSLNQATVPQIHRRTNKQGVKTVHVFVALCDNKYQGIVPVGKSIGNGQDPASNLYWGCDNGVKAYFKKKTSDWTLIQVERKISDTILERLLFKHKTQNVYLFAEAYNGKFIRQTTIDFLNAASGNNSKEIVNGKDSLYFGGASNLVAYIGHDGLMDFKLPLQKPSTNPETREVIILACYSQYYFSPFIKSSGATPLLWTSNLMAPEAYTLHDALREWIANKSPEQIRLAAAEAYSKYQDCSLKAAKNLLVSGW